MKIIKRVDFLNLPENTVFAEYQPMYFGPLTIKGETWLHCNDFLEQQIVDAIDCSGSEEFAEILERAPQTGESIPMDFEDNQGRDGCFDPPDRLYAVFEENDVRALMERLQKCLPLTYGDDL